LSRLADEGVIVDPQNICYGRYDHQVAGKEAIKLVKQGVEAIFAVSDLMAVGALKAMQRKGVRIPDDIALVGFGNTLHSRLTTPELTSIDLQSHQVGSKSTTVLLNIIEGKEVKAVNTLLTKLVRREST
jgi:DNA-binding LacI/PurR family transcriptional regulator